MKGEYVTLEEIKWIATLYEVGNITKAAEKLYISQSALSQCLKRVEDQLGLQLFLRSGKRIVPTENAKLFSEMAKDMIVSYGNFLEKAFDRNDAPLGKIRIAIPATINELILDKLLPALDELHPSIEFKIIEANAAEMWEALSQNRVDLILINGTSNIVNTVAYPIMDIETKIFLRKNSAAIEHVHTVDGVAYLDPKHLKNEPMVLMGEGHTSTQIAKALFRQCGFEPLVAQKSRSPHTVLRYVSKGVGSSIGFSLPIDENTECEGSESVIICRVPREYRLSITQAALHVVPEKAASIPQDVYLTISRLVRKVLETAMI